METCSEKVVPPLDNFLPKLYELTQPQKEFYECLKKSVNKNKYLNIEDNVAYVYLYAYEIINNFLDNLMYNKQHSHFHSKKHIEKDIRELSKLREIFCKNLNTIEFQNLHHFLCIWIADFYLIINDYNCAWQEIRKGRISLSHIYNIRSKCSETYLDGGDLIHLLRSETRISEIGKNYIDRIEILTSKYLETFQSIYQENIVKQILNQFEFWNLTELDFEKIKEYYKNEESFHFWKTLYLKESLSIYQTKEYNHVFFSGVGSTIDRDRDNSSPSRSDFMPCIKLKVIPTFLQIAIEDEMKRILRDAENIVREEKKLPKVGEGWISETELFYKISCHYPNEKIINHGRPLWLGKQHLDIYFPKRNIGIEYHGIQHLQPIEYFGGVKGFENTQSRDKRKVELCLQNDCLLIPAYKGYSLENIINQIQERLDKLE